MLKRMLLPLLAVAVLAACGNEDEATTSAPEASSPSTSTPAVPAAPPAAEAPAAPAEKAAAVSGGGDLVLGESVYKKTCFLCHGTGAGGAPMLTKADWDPRIAQGKDVLYKHSIEGYTGDKGMMPAKGGNPSLSDEDVKASVDYMLSQLK